MAIDDSNTMNNMVAQRGRFHAFRRRPLAVTLVAATAAGDTVIKVNQIQTTGNNATPLFYVGNKVRIEQVGSTNYQLDTVKSIGTTGATGTGVTLTAPLTVAHPTGTSIQDMGHGIDLATPLARDVPAGTTSTARPPASSPTVRRARSSAC